MAARTDGTGTGMRLRWWVVVLPVAAFLALLALLLTGTGAEAADQQPLAELVARIGGTLVP